jgi:hypothetical protein
MTTVESNDYVQTNDDSQAVVVVRSPNETVYVGPGSSVGLVPIEGCGPMTCTIVAPSSATQQQIQLNIPWVGNVQFSTGQETIDNAIHAGLEVVLAAPIEVAVLGSPAGALALAVFYGGIAVYHGFHDTKSPDPVIVPQGVFAATDANYTVNVARSGVTTLQVLGGSVGFYDPQSNGSVIVQAGQMLTLPQEQSSGFNSETLLQGVTSFNPSSVDQWWLTSSTQTNSTQTTANLPPAQVINLQAGQTATEGLPGCAAMVLQGSTSQSGAELQANATGSAARWVTPSSIDFGYLASGACDQRSYGISVPLDTTAGSYPLVWLFTCPAGNGSVSCSEGSYSANVVVTASSSPTSSSSCYPDCPPQITKIGDVSLVDASGAIVNVFTTGDIASTGANSMFGESSASGTAQMGPNTVIGWLSVNGGSTGFTSYPDDSPFYHTFNAQTTELQLEDPFNSTQVTHAALDEMAHLVAVGGLGSTITSAPITMLEVAGGELHALGTQQDQTETICIVSSVMIACPTATELTVSAQNNGTSIDDMSGNMLVASFVTGDYTTLRAGQSLFIPSNLAQASQQNLSESVQPSNQSGSNKWWTELSTQPASGYPSYENLIGAAVLIAVAGVIALLFVRRRSEKPAESGHVSVPAETTAASQAAVQPKAQPEVSMETLDKLSKLKALLDSGAISVDEFERMKAPILESGTVATRRNQ